MPKTDGRTALGIDLGGTKILTALVTQEGRIVSQESTPTEAKAGPKAVIEQMLQAIGRAVKLGGVKPNDLAGTALAIAGIIDTHRGIVTTSPNLPGWKDVPLRDEIAQKLGTITYLVNDADAAALGENRFGAGRGTRHMVYITVSTGIGGGIIINGELYSGANGCAGEFGHMTIDPNGPKCACGRNGCWEAMASGTAIAREARRRLAAGEKSLLNKGTAQTVTAEKVGEATKKGDRLAAEVIMTAGHYLGIGLANIINIFNPEIIVIGGGVSNLGDMLLNPAREAMRQRAFDLPLSTVRIVRSQIGVAVGALGATALVFDKAAKGQRS
ncbi:MAG: ROK family protein [Chloroflexota bacterium]